MRQDINALCITTWGAVLEFKGWHSQSLFAITGRYTGRHASYITVAHVADPDAIDCGQFINAHEIVLIARKK
jgi:hypothetical protein